MAEREQEGKWEQKGLKWKTGKDVGEAMRRWRKYTPGKGKDGG